MSDTPKVRTVCAWCGKLIHDLPPVMVNGRPIDSHGICQPCALKQRQEISR